MRRLIVPIAMVLYAVGLNAQWVIQKSETTASLRGIHYVGKGVAWASGTDGTVLRTTDGGVHWQKCAVPPDAGKLDFRGVQAFDESSAIVMSSGTGPLSRLYKTTDGCRTWKLVLTNPDPDGFFDAIRLTSRKHGHADEQCFGVLLGDPVANQFVLFVTQDCGNTWQRQQTIPEAMPGEGVFAASNSALNLEGPAAREFVTGGPSGARLLSFKTYVSFSAPEGYKPSTRPPYHFAQWSSKQIPLSHPSKSAGGFSMVWVEGQGTVVVGGDYQQPERCEQCAWYWNGELGKMRFETARTRPGGYRSAVAYDAGDKTLITVGPNGTDMSHDFARNWIPLKPDTAKGDVPDADRNWNAISLPFVVGPNGRIGKLRRDALKRKN